MWISDVVFAFFVIIFARTDIRKVFIMRDESEQGELIGISSFSNSIANKNIL